MYYYVYVLHSISGGKTYTGFTNDVSRRLIEHNVTESNGFTLRYRPWILIYQEKFQTKQEAMLREKYLKTGRGREEIKVFIKLFLDDQDAVSAVAEKD